METLIPILLEASSRSIVGYSLVKRNIKVQYAYVKLKIS
jgi:hypothetical protein